MKENTYYAKNRKKILEKNRQKIKTYEDRMKTVEYNKKYYISNIIKLREKQNKRNELLRLKYIPKPRYPLQKLQRIKKVKPPPKKRGPTALPKHNWEHIPEETDKIAIYFD